MEDPTSSEAFLKLCHEDPRYGNSTVSVIALLKALHGTHFDGKRDCQWITQHDLNIIVCRHGLGVALADVKRNTGVERN